jgi:hypothetical protein
MTEPRFEVHHHPKEQPRKHIKSDDLSWPMTVLILGSLTLGLAGCLLGMLIFRTT